MPGGIIDAFGAKNPNVIIGAGAAEATGFCFAVVANFEASV